MNTKNNTEEQQGFIVMVEQFTKNPDILRITTYIGKEKINSIDQLNKDNTDSMFTFFKKIDERHWVDFERPELKDPAKLSSILSGSSPTEDWIPFKHVLWGKQETGAEGVLWDQTNFDRLTGQYKNCCDTIDKGLKTIMDYSKSAIEEIKSGKAEGKSNTPVVLVVESWKDIEDKCNKCLEIEKSAQEQIRSITDKAKANDKADENKKRNGS